MLLKNNLSSWFQDGVDIAKKLMLVWDFAHDIPKNDILSVNR
jgi:hypothetical protein